MAGRTPPHPSLLVGCGGRAQTHAEALADSDRFELVAVCDLVEEKARETATNFDVPEVYTDFQTAFERERPSHVSAIMPPDARIPVVPDVLALEPESLIIEKPVANTLPDVERVVDAAAAVDTRVVVCHQKPFADELQALASWVDEGRLGEITRMVGTTKLGLLGQGTHFVHAMNWLLDQEPERVVGWAHGPEGLDPGPGGHAEPEDAVYELTYPDDTRGFVHNGWSAPDVPAQADNTSLEYRLDVIGTDGRAAYVLGNHAEGIFADGRERVEARPFDEDAYMTRALYERLSEVVTGEAESHPAELSKAAATHRALDAALRSAVEGRPVDVAQNPPAVGENTNERLRRQLTGRKPVTVSSLVYGDRSRGEVLDSLASLGVTQVDLWAMEGFVDYHADPENESAGDIAADLDARAVEAPVVSVFDDEPVVPKLELAAELGADSVVMGGRSPERPDQWDPEQTREWLDAAHERGLTLAFENHLDSLETVEEMESLVDALDHPAAGICLAPPHLHIAGGTVEDAITRLNDDIAVLYLWDAEPGVTRETAQEMWYGRADSQVPGGGGAVDFERALDLAVEYCPEAHWVLCCHGTGDWDQGRVEQWIARSLRFLEARRPA